MSEIIEVKVSSFGSKRKYLMMRYTCPVTGKRTARSTGTTVKREAERVAAKWEAELREGRYAPASKMTWQDFGLRYFAEVLPGLADKTGDLVGSVFNAFGRLTPPRRLADVTSGRLSKFAAALRAEGKAEPTIRSYLAHLRSALQWAVDMGLLPALPKIPKVQRSKASKLMKGRPPVAEEYERMLAATEKVVGPAAAPAWRHYLEGLWLSGLRLSESLRLTWDRPDRPCIDLTGRRPMLRMPGEFQKSGQNQLLPLAPEFCEFLAATPEDQRRGRVFRLPGLHGIPQPRWVSEILSRIGQAAGVKVNTHPKTGKVKFASAHDLRRAFGTRWASRVKPATLQLLMRHKSIDTTLKYYVALDADDVADELWAAHPGNTCGFSGRNGSSMGRQETTEPLVLQGVPKCPLMDSNHQPSD